MLGATRAGLLKPVTETTDFYSSILDTCIRTKSLLQAKLIHQHLLKNHTTTNPSINLTSLLEKLVKFYVSCNKIYYARNLFGQIPQRPKNVLTWNLLIRAYAWNGPFDEAIELYYEMLELGVGPSKYTFPFVLKACSVLQALNVGKEIHDHVKMVRLESDVYVSTALVDMYAKCGSLVDAKSVFYEMKYRDVVAWNSMIAGLSLGGECYEEMVKLLVEMQRDVRPNSSTMAALLPGVGHANALRHGKAVHGFCVRRDFNFDVIVATGLLDMYGKCQCIPYAKRIFDMMGAVKNEVTWSAMICGYVMCDYMSEALELFRLMMMLSDGVTVVTAVTLATVIRACAKLSDLSRGKCLHCYAIKSGFALDLMVVNTLLSMYAKSGIMNEAISLFDEIDTKDTVSFGAIIAGCVQNGNAQKALHMFQKMRKSGISPDIATMVSILPACSHLAALQHGSCCHSYVVVRGFVTDIPISNALIDMYAKCGRIDTSRNVFDKMRMRDIVSWNTMIMAYGIHGLGMEALSLFNRMQLEGLEPDDVTFISVLCACSHSGLITEGKHWFYAMNKDFNIIQRMEHCICMVDLFSRAGRFDEAQNFIEKMPLEPDVRIWGALLAACRVHKNVELGEEVSNKIHRLGPESTGNFVLLSNMYSAVGRWDDAAQVRITQKEQGFKKIPGCSWIEIDGNVHAFTGGDDSHPQSLQIKNKIHELLVEMKRLGYQAESDYALHDVEEEEKEGMLLYHSEKLAIALAILNLSPKKPILVTKNLRVCGDCHTAIKYISLITKRDITVRDASRFHHFKDGICNCGDFW